MADSILDGGGGSDISKAKPDASLTDFDKRVFESMRKVLWIPDDFKEYMTQYQALNQPPISIAQVFGFSQFAVQSAETIVTSQATTSTSYTDLGTVGPQLTGLPDGRYVFLFGCIGAPAGASTSAWISLQVNGTAAVDADGTRNASNGVGVPYARAVTKTLSTGGNNTAKVVYRSDTGTSCTYLNRWLYGFRYANL